MTHVKGNSPRCMPTLPPLENPFSLEASDDRVKKKILAGSVASDKVPKSGKATPRGMEPDHTKISAIADQISQKSTSQKVWDAMPWGAVVGLVMAFVGGIVMLTGVSLFYATRCGTAETTPWPASAGMRRSSALCFSSTCAAAQSPR